MALKRKEKAALAALLLAKAGDIVEYWDEMKTGYPELEGTTAKEAALALGKMLKKLPGDVWDTRLTESGLE